MTIETARRASLEFVCVFGHDALVCLHRVRGQWMTPRTNALRRLLQEHGLNLPPGAQTTSLPWMNSVVERHPRPKQPFGQYMDRGFVVAQFKIEFSESCLKCLDNSTTFGFILN